MNADGGWRARLEGSSDAIEVTLPVHLPSRYAEATLDERDVVLEREVVVETPSHLVLDGIGPIAEVRVDGEPVLTARNLFRRHRVPLSAGALVASSGALTVNSSSVSSSGFVASICSTSWCSSSVDSCSRRMDCCSCGVSARC